MKNERYELFLEMMDAFNRMHDDMAEYGRLPRIYGGFLFYEREVHLLRSIGNTPGISITELAKEFRYTTSACSQIVKKMCEKGFVEKKKNSRNNKEISLYLTEPGNRIYQYHDKFDGMCYKRNFDHLGEFTDKEIEITAAVTRRFNECIERDIERTKRGKMQQDHEDKW